MDFKKLQFLKVLGLGDWKPDADISDLGENAILETRGFRNSRPGIVCSRDFGTKHRFYSYPIRPNAFKAVTNAVDNGSGLIRLTITGHSFSNGATMNVNEVGGTVEANGVWVAIVIDPDTIDLTGSTMTNAYTSGGIASVTPITIIRSEILIDSATGYEHEIIFGLDSSNNSRVFIDTSSTQIGTWVELTQKVTATINDASIGADDTALVISTNVVDGANTIAASAFANDYFKDWICYNSTQGEYAYVTASAGTTITFLEKIGSNGLGWATTNALEFYRNDVSKSLFTYSNGTAPHARINVQSSLKKATVYYGNPSTRVYGTPIQMVRREATKTILNSLVTLPASWYTRNAQLMKDCVVVGTQAAPITSGNATKYISNGIAIKYEVITEAIAADDQLFGRVVVTAQFGYEESDPIFKIYVDPASIDSFPRVDLDFYVNPTEMPKGLTGFNVYASFGYEKIAGTATGENQANTPEDFEKFLFINSADTTNKDTTVDINSTIFDSTAYSNIDSSGVKFYKYNNTSESINLARYQANGSNINLLKRLGHAPDFNRSYMTPRFFSRAKNSQGSLIGVDQDDNVVRVSTYDGFGVHEDDNFPDVDTDVNRFKQKYYLESVGELLGLSVDHDNIVAFKRFSIEIIDLQSSVQETIPADVTSKDSIFYTPYGTFWCGESGIYFLPISGGDIQPINPNWIRRYDGSEFVTGVTPYISSTYRQASVGGYDPYYARALFAIQTNKSSGSEYLIYIYDIRNGKWDGVRKIGNGTTSGLQVTHFSRRKDETLTIGGTNALLEYPHKSGSYLYQDMVKKNGSGSEFAGNGFESLMLFNVGGIYSLSQNITLMTALLDHIGSSITGSGVFNLKFFANRVTTAWDSKTQAYDSKAFPRNIAPRGLIESLQIEISTVSGSESDAKALDCVLLELGYNTHSRVGNH